MNTSHKTVGEETRESNVGDDRTIQGKSMRILVVDDELVSRAKMQKILSGLGDCVAVESGREAIAAYTQARGNGAPFDLMTLDISMPEMDGQEVLLEVRNIEKQRDIPAEQRLKILMVTAHADQKSVLTCIKLGCDGYILKPFDKNVVHAKLTEYGMGAGHPSEQGQSHIVQDLTEQFISDFEDGKLKLPVLPSVVRELDRLRGDPNVTINRLAEIVEQDPVISARVIAVANSPMYFTTHPIRTVVSALRRLGFKGTYNIVTALGSRSFYDTDDADLKSLTQVLWTHSLACGFAARAIGIRLHFRDPDRLFLMGMLHDLGKILLLSGIRTMLPDDTEPTDSEILDGIQRAHADFGARVLSDWGFPEEFTKSIQLHEEIELHPLTDKAALITHLANNLTRVIGFSQFPMESGRLLDVSSRKLLQMEAGSLEEIGAEVRELVDQMAVRV